MNSNASEETLESMSQAVWYNRWTLKKFSSFLKGDILEVGCGIGNFTQLLRSYRSVWAIDINNEYIEQTKKNVNGGVRMGVGDIEKGSYFFERQRFDTVVCLNVLEHISDDNKALENLYKLLRKKGYLILLVPAHQFLYGQIDKSIGHFRRYSKKKLESKLKKIGFNIINSKKVNLLGSIGWFIEGKIFKKSKIEESKVKIFNLLAPFFLNAENFAEPPMGTSILTVAQKI